MARKPREYCCCAIPLVNAGIYSALLFQMVVGTAVGLVSITTPSIVGAHTPAIASWVVAIIAFLGAGIQLLGFIGVKKEKPTLFQRYTTFHLLLNLVGFSVAAAWIIMSATGHNAAVTACDAEFFASGTQSTSQEGQILCDIFPWVDVGIMGALFILIGIAQIYFYFLISGYGSMQRTDHKRFDSMYDPSQPLTSDIGLNTKEGDPWGNTRPSVDNQGHGRQESVDSVMNMSYESQTNHAGAGGYAGAYPPQRQPTRGNTAPNQPNQAYTQQEAPTPTYKDPYYDGYGAGGSTGLSRPPASQAHPAEGSFHRKTPRATRPDQPNYQQDYAPYPQTSSYR